MDVDLTLRDVITELNYAGVSLDAIDETLQQISNVLLDGTSEVKERRRYALLQAASILLAADGRYSEVSIKSCAGAAESLLAEIERREEAEERS